MGEPITTTPVLLPCPFCGGAAIRITLNEADGPDNAGGDVICCVRCDASSNVEFGRKESLVSNWNRRATPDLRDVVRELVDALTFVLPLAKGYAAQNDHAVNHECIEIARATIAKAEGVL